MTPPLTPIHVELRGGAVIIGAAALVLLAVPPLVANGRQLLSWGDLLLLALAVIGVVLLRRQRRAYREAEMLPSQAVLVPDRTVMRRQAAWGVPYLLFVLWVAATVPDFFGFGLVCAALALGLTVEARHLRHWQTQTGDRIYRGKRGWSRTPIYRAT